MPVLRLAGRAGLVAAFSLFAILLVTPPAKADDPNPAQPGSGPATTGHRHGHDAANSGE
jgi:hypothetical protein